MTYYTTPEEYFRLKLKNCEIPKTKTASLQSLNEEPKVVYVQPKTDWGMLALRTLFVVGLAFLISSGLHAIFKSDKK